MPFYSIVIASFNDERNIRNLSNSINSQNFEDYEVIISDGGSSDNTIEFITSGGIRNLAWYKSSKDNGIYDALNIALEHVSGKWILVIGADDELADNESLMLANRLLSDLPSNVAIAYSDLLIKRNSKIALKKYPDYQKFKENYGGGAFIHHQTAFIKSEFLFMAGNFSDMYKIHADYDLILKISKLAEVKKIQGSFVIFDANGYSSKLSNLLVSFFEIYNIRKSHGLFAMPIRLLITYLALLTRRLLPFIKL